MEQKTVFISYRRDKSKHLARSIYLELKAHDYDSFLDVNTIDSGDFDQIIMNQIGARAHFILLISKGSMERCKNKGDWLLQEIQEAVQLKRNIVPLYEEDVNLQHEYSYLPRHLRRIIDRKNALRVTHDYFDAGMDKLRTRFLKTPEYVRIQETSAVERLVVRRLIDAIEAEIPQQEFEEKIILPPSIDIMPKPFDWIDIPKKGYSITKYPITNSQFATFIKADGYNNSRWWTKQGWEHRVNGRWAKPRYFNNKKWNGTEQPIIGITWYEANAFCFWLSEITGEAITLPTEDQWQYASQGGDNRIYPWGNKWDSNLCNNNVHNNSIKKTTSVRYYEEKYDSPFGVIDTVGNVWEWCSKNNLKNTN